MSHLLFDLLKDLLPKASLKIVLLSGYSVERDHKLINLEYAFFQIPQGLGKIVFLSC